MTTLLLFHWCRNSISNYRYTIWWKRLLIGFPVTCTFLEIRWSLINCFTPSSHPFHFVTCRILCIIRYVSRTKPRVENSDRWFPLIVTAYPLRPPETIRRLLQLLCSKLHPNSKFSCFFFRDVRISQLVIALNEIPASFVIMGLGFCSFMYGRIGFCSCIFRTKAYPLLPWATKGRRLGPFTYVPLSYGGILLGPLLKIPVP